MRKLSCLWAAANLCLLIAACGGAHFSTTCVLTVNSTNPSSGLTIDVSPADTTKATAGSTSFARTYMPGTVVTLTAPGTSSGNAFSSWTGCSTTSTVVCTVTLNANTTVTAAYGTSTLLTPTVTVTLSATSITSQALPVTIAVSGPTGSATPTGSITLSSGTYTSAATTLAGGSATITVAAGSLSTGTDILNATYTPDTVGSATYNTATGTATVTVTSTSTPQPTVTLTANPASIASGGSSTLTWSSTNATSCTASGSWTGTEATSGSQGVSPASTSTYTLTCTGAGGSANASAMVTVTGSTVPTVTLTASPATIAFGAGSSLTWSSTNATSCDATGGWDGLKATSGGTQSVSPTSTTTYILACTNSSGSAVASATVTITSSTPAPTVLLTASPTNIASGGSSTLTWSTTNATSCTASGGWSGAEGTSGTQSVSPAATTTYMLVCTGTGGLGNASAIVTATGSTSSSGATLVFSYPNGFSSSDIGTNPGLIHLVTGSAELNGSNIALTDPTYGEHQAGSAWYVTQQNIEAFTTDFTFQQDPTAYGMVFCIQNSNSTTNPSNSGIWAGADANGEGYGVYTGQTPIGNSIAIKFDLTQANGSAYLGASPSSTGLYINGGPPMGGGFIPENDLSPSGINLHSGDVMAAHIVYDGSILTMLLTDTMTGANTRMSWPVDIPAIVGGNSAWVGMAGGTIPNVYQQVLTWDFYEGYNPRLAVPAFSVPAGSYTSAQTVSLSASSGATIYYSTDGQAPTTSSTQYTGPITVSASEVVQSIAVETGYTDSSVAAANYQIAPSGSPLINFPNGFANASSLIIPTGSAQFSGSAIEMTNTANSNDYLESGAAWYAVPVNVQNFTTNFTIQPMTSNPSNVEGITFTIQNQNPASSDSSSIYVSGGPYTVGVNQTGLGYQGILNSAVVAFAVYNGSNAGQIGFYTGGAAPTGSSVDLSSAGSKLNLQSNHPFAVTLNYNGTTLAMTVTDTVTNASYTNSWAINIPATVGGNTAYVGFTSATGWYVAAQNVLSWTYATTTGN